MTATALPLPPTPHESCQLARNRCKVGLTLPILIRGEPMASLASELQLRPDELAFYFRSEEGVDALELGVFLQRAATVARSRGADLRVTATREGSLAVILRAVRKSSIAKNARKEFTKAPIATTAAGAGLVGMVAGAIIYAMSPNTGKATPLAKAGADVVEQSHVTEIHVVTLNKTTVVMDEIRARQVREVVHRRKRRIPALSRPEVQELIGYAREGSLSGAVLDVGGELHFRPDGYRYLVPIDPRSEAAEELFPDAHFQVRGEVTTHHGQPNTIIIHSARRV